MESQRKIFGVNPIIIAAIIVICIGGGAYYFLNKNSATNESPDTTQQPLDDTACMDAIDDQDFCRFVSSWNRDDSKVIRLTSSEDGSVVTSRTNGPDSHTTILSANGMKNEIITLNSISYMKNQDGDTWNELGDAGNALPADDFTPKMDFADESIKNNVSVQRLGEEACEDKACLKYQVKNMAAPDTEVLVWFDTEQYQVRRMTTKTNQNSVDMTFTYEDVTIEKPSSVSKLPAFEGTGTEE